MPIGALRSAVLTRVISHSWNKKIWIACTCTISGDKEHVILRVVIIREFGVFYLQTEPNLFFFSRITDRLLDFFSFFQGRKKGSVTRYMGNVSTATKDAVIYTRKERLSDIQGVSSGHSTCFHFSKLSKCFLSGSIRHLMFSTCVSKCFLVCVERERELKQNRKWEMKISRVEYLPPPQTENIIIQMKCIQVKLGW